MLRLVIFATLWAFCLSCKQSPPSQKVSPLAITFPISTTVQSIDPLFATNEATGIVATLIHRYLFKVNHLGKTKADLVIKEKVDPKEKLWILELKRGKLTASDVAKSLNRVIASKRFYWVFDGIKKITALEQYQLAISFYQKPSRQFLKSLKTRLSLPPCAVLKWKNDKPIIDKTFGEYYLKKNDLNKVILKRSNGELHNAGSWQANQIILKVVKDKASKQFLFQKNHFDYYEASGPYALLNKFPNNDEKGWSIKQKTLLTVIYAAMMQNQDKNNILNNLSFRQWLNYQFSQDLVCRKLLQNSCYASDIPVPPQIGIKLVPKYFTQVGLSKSELGLFRQRQLILLKKWRQEVSLYIQNQVIQIFTPPDLMRQSIAQVIFQTLKKVGLKPKFNVYDLSTLVKLNNDKVAGIYIFKWIADYPHFENFLIPLFHSKNLGSKGNRAYYIDSQTDYYLDNLNKQTSLRKVLQRIREQAPWIFVGFDQKKVFYNTKKLSSFPLTYTGWWSFFSKK